MARDGPGRVWVSYACLPTAGKLCFGVCEVCRTLLREASALCCCRPVISQIFIVLSIRLIVLTIGRRAEAKSANFVCGRND